MDLLIVRHAIAFERDPQRWSDDGTRPLTPEGKRRAKKAAAGLKRFTKPPDRLLTSPLIRARQTAQILTEVAGWPQAEEVAALSPEEAPQSLLALLGKHRSEVVAIVGHQPGLGQLLSACLLGEDGNLPIDLKKNAVACVSFRGSVRAGRATLKWLATPRMLRALRSD